MNKPFTLIINETRDKIVEIVNNANLPAFCVEIILKDVLNQVESIDNAEIEKYKNELNNSKIEKEEKENGV